MTSEANTGSNPNEALWHDVLLHGHHSRWSFLPSDPRCMVCRQPFYGLGGRLLRMFTGYGPSRMIPNICNHCTSETTPDSSGGRRTRRRCPSPTARSTRWCANSA